MTYGQFRKHIYASINGTKGNLVKLSKSPILKKDEKLLLYDVINSIEILRKTFSEDAKQN